MPSGGARSRSGPPPDPTALRRDRAADAGDWTILPAVREDPIPDWPLTVEASPAELTHWNDLWTRPQATQWEAQAVEVQVALYVRNLAIAEIPGAPVGLVKEVRLMQDDLGLSLGSMLRHRWKVADTPLPSPATGTSSPAAARPASQGKSSRDRFRVVKPVEDS